MMTESDLQEDTVGVRAPAPATPQPQPQQQPNPQPAPHPAPHPPPHAAPHGANGAVSDLVCDCRRMLRYARKNGMVLAPELVGVIAQLDSILVSRRLEPVADIDEALVAPVVAPMAAAAVGASAVAGGAALQPPAAVNPQIMLLMAHQELSTLIAPTTALTLAVSEPSPGKHRLMGGVPLVVKSAAFLAVGGALLFMATAHALGSAASAGIPIGLDSLLLSALNILAGAALGAAFYVLVKTQPYLVTRSYDPTYNAVYIARFITGVIGGVILATALGPALKDALGSVPGVAHSSSGILAILGGYAAEAVESILQRIVEIMLAAIRGDGSGQAQIKAMAAHADMRAAVENILPDLRDASGDPAKVQAAIQKIRTVLMNA